MPPEALAAAPGGRQLFVYYRVAALDRDACVQAVQALQADLMRTHPGLRCALLQRPEGDDAAGQRTLMETYARPDGIDATLQARIDQIAGVALAPWLIGPRHVEVFEPCA